MRHCFQVFALLSIVSTLQAQEIQVLRIDPEKRVELTEDSVLIFNPSQHQDWILISGRYDSLEVDVLDATGSLIQSYRLGWAYPLSEGQFLHGVQSSPAITVVLSDTSYIRVRRKVVSAAHLTSIPAVLIMSTKEFKNSNTLSAVIMALITGVLLSLAAYNLILFFSVRDRGYLFYVVRQVSFLVLWIHLYEYPHLWFWPSSPEWNKYSFWLIVALCGTLTILFSSDFLEIRKVNPRFQSILRYTIWGYPIMALVGIFNLLPFIIYNFVSPFIFLAVIIPVIRDPKLRHYRPLRYYKLAFGFFLAGVFIAILSRIYILPINFLTQHAVLMGVVLDALFFSIGLADRINIFKSEAEMHKQQLAVKQAEHNIIRHNLEEKELLLKEIHHRVKNNLQLIYSLLNLQKQHIDEPQSLLAIENSQLRVKSMSLVHQMLYESEELKEIDLSIYLSDLIQNIVDTVLTKAEKMNVNVQLQSSLIPLDTAIPLGLIINELINNACKYAVKNSPNSQLNVSCKTNGTGDFLIGIEDSGPGIKGFDGRQPTFQSLGLQLVYDLVKQLKGSISYRYEKGSHFEIEIPNRNHD